MKNFRDKVVAITGAGAGIGRATAVNLASRGALLALADVNEVGLKETADLIESAGLGSAITTTVDVRDRGAVAMWADQVADHFGRVNVAINNAGVAIAGDIVDLSYEDMEWIVNINFWGVVHGTKEFLPHLIASGDGHLVNVSSMFGLAAAPTQSMYSATKFAVRGFSEAIREDLLIAGHKVNVTVVHPGGIKTDIVTNARTSAHTDEWGTKDAFNKLARLSTERAAQVIVRGVRRNKPRVLIGADAHAIHQFQRLAGPRYADLLARVVKSRLPSPVA